MPRSLEVILDDLTAARADKIAAQSREDACLDELAQLADSGDFDASEPLTWNDWTISRRSKRSYRYPTSIVEQSDALKAAQKLAVAMGDAEVIITSFWEIRQPRP